jgi:mannan endo-1,4-beta-mannosidase
MKYFLFYVVTNLILSGTVCSQSVPSRKPVAHNASNEAVQLLDYLYSISGKKTLTGQHDQPIFGSAYYQLVYERTGYHPAVKGMDFGFSEPNTLDGINFRQLLVDEAIAYHSEGSIITLMWHAVPPTKDEPVVFRRDIQGDLSDEEWNELLTPDSDLNRRWQSQVDVIAFFLKQLRDAHIPVLWRPYHEMNGDWFWWGKKTGENGYIKLYRMLYDRLVNYHKLNNLIWVFNANEIRGDYIDPYEFYYPGHEYVDILATDVYSGQYPERDYHDLQLLAEGRPIALGEVGKMPTPEILSSQPDWIWFMTWVDIVFQGNTRDELHAIYEADNTLTREEVTLSYPSK